MKIKSITAFSSAFAAVLFATTFAFQATRVNAATLEIIVPAYFYPSSAGSYWDTLTTQASLGTPITAIMNPASGPGSASNSDYTAAVNSFRAAGGRVLGYVPTGYAGVAVNSGSSCQPAIGTNYTTSDVLACANLYSSLYHVDGIFLDEFTNNNSAASLAFYRTLYSGIKGPGGINPLWQVVGNPGANTSSVYIDPVSGLTADLLVTIEQTASVFPSIAASANLPGSRQVYLVYDAATFAQASQFVSTASQRGVSAIFVNNDNFCQAQAVCTNANSDFNPWDTLPPYFADVSAQVRSLNAQQQVPLPASSALLLMGLLALPWSRRKPRVSLT